MNKILTIIVITFCMGVYGVPIKSNLGNKGIDYVEASEYTVADYIQNGLVAMWDGIENASHGIHDPNANIWKNLVSETEAEELTPVFGGNRFSVNENSFHLRSNGFNGKIPRLLDYFGSRNFTMQFVARSNSSSAETVWLFRLVSTTLSIGGPNNYTGSANYGMLNSGTWSTNFKAIFGSTYLLTYTSASVGTDGQNVSLYNGVERTANYSRSGNSMPSAATGLFTIGISGPPNNNRYFLNADVFAIRFYSRALTSNEIAHNYAIDKERFNIQ